MMVSFLSVPVIGEITVLSFQEQEVSISRNAICAWMGPNYFANAKKKEVTMNLPWVVNVIVIVDCCFSHCCCCGL